MGAAAAAALVLLALVKISDADNSVLAVAAVASPESQPPHLDGSSTVPASFRPSIAVIVGVLTTMFSLTFLLLIYAKHCKRNPVGMFGSDDAAPLSAVQMPMIQQAQQLVFRSDMTGIDPAVVEALPTFCFSSLKGNKDGLECAVCLCKYEDRELLRLLPKCKHAFHVDCVDTWLASHSTCPLCRNRVTADDLVAVDEMLLLMLSSRRRSSMDHEAAIPPPAAAADDDDDHDQEQQLSRRRSLDIDLGSGSFQIYVQRADQRQEHEEQDDGSTHAHDQEEQQHLFAAPADHAQKDVLRRLGHRIIISDVILQRRWSDLVPSDVLFLSNFHTLFWPSSRGCSSSRIEPPAVSMLKRALSMGRPDVSSTNALRSQRCMSEMTGLDRFSSNSKKICKEDLLLPFTLRQQQQQQHEDETRWSSIARRTLNWIMRRDVAHKSSLKY